jgi:hypothetical protein
LVLHSNHLAIQKRISRALPGKGGRRGAIGLESVVIRGLRLSQPPGSYASVTAVKIIDAVLNYFLHPVQRAMIASDLHAILPALDEVQTIVATFFAGGEGTELLPLNLQRETPSRVSIG